MVCSSRPGKIVFPPLEKKELGYMALLQGDTVRTDSSFKGE